MTVYYGTSGTDILVGGNGNDTLIGGGGADTLIGGAGTDTASYSNSSSGVTINLATGVSTGDAAGDVYDGIEIIAGSNKADTFVVGAKSYSFVGGYGTDTLSYAAATSGVSLNVGYSAGDTLGSDSLGNQFSKIERIVGSAYGDTYTVTTSVGLVEAANGGTDEVRTTLSSYILADNIENLTYLGTGAFTGTGNASNNIIIGGNGNDTLIGGGGADTLIGGAGADSLNGGDGIDIASYSTATDAVTINLTTGVNTGDAKGDSYNSVEILQGSIYNDTFVGTSGNNTFIGGGGADMLIGGDGTDTASYSTATQAVSINFHTGVNTGDAEGDIFDSIEIIQGSNYDDVFVGNEGANTFYGGVGSDTVSYASSAAAVTVNLMTGTGSGGDAQGDIISSVECVVGSAYADTLIGGAGADMLTGGAGLDTVSYESSSAAVTVNLTVGTGAGGDADGDVLTSLEHVIGSAFADTLISSTGGTTLEGGAGNDIYVVGNSSTAVLETADGGLDEVQTELSTYTLGANVEALTYLGSESFIGTGNTSDNIIIGGRNDDTLIGKGGDDLLDGGAGKDIAIFSGSYFDYEIASIATEWSVLGAGGTTKLRNMERLQFEDYQIYLDGTNNAPILRQLGIFDNTDEGTATLEVDLLRGASDFDGNPLSVTGLAQSGGRTVSYTVVDGTLLLDPAQFNDLAEGESETVSFTYGVSDGIAQVAQTLTVTVMGSNDVPVVAQALTVSTTEDSAALTLNLLAGTSDADASDSLSVTGLAQSGGRTVSYTVVDGTLLLDPAQFNDLAEGESETVSFTYGVSDGIAQVAQTLTVTVMGSNEILLGSTGTDTLIGGVGDDTLIGSDGADTYEFGSGGGNDLVNNIDHGLDGDVIQFWDGIAVDQLWFAQSDADLVIRIIGTSDSISVDDWYMGDSNRVSQFVTGDGQVLLNTAVQNLVNAMAGMTTPALGQTTFTAEEHAVLDGVIAANWSK